MKRRFGSTVVAAIALSVALGACVKSGDGDLPGVSATTIRLGVLTDLSGVFAPLGTTLVQGNQLYWSEQNEAGGVCGRRVRLIVRDHRYDPQTAIALYREIAPNVLALQQLLGSPIAAALLRTIERDEMLTPLAGWPSSLAASRFIQITGTTYDIETVNGVDHLVRTNAVRPGDAVGHLYFEGDYGENALLGSRYAAERHGLEIVEQKIKPSDVDMSAQVAALRRAGVKAIVASVGPRQTASLAGVAASAGFEVPIIANGPSFAPQLLATPAKASLEDNVTVVSSTAPFSLDSPMARKVAAAWRAAHPKDTPTGAVQYGYAMALVTAAAIRRGCRGGKPSRRRVVDALRRLSHVDTGGLTPALDFSRLGDSPSREVYISRVDAREPGGLRVIRGLSASALAQSYEVP